MVFIIMGNVIWQLKKMRAGKVLKIWLQGFKVSLWTVAANADKKTYIFNLGTVMSNWYNEMMVNK